MGYRMVRSKGVRLGKAWLGHCFSDTSPKSGKMAHCGQCRGQKNWHSDFTHRCAGVKKRYKTNIFFEMFVFNHDSQWSITGQQISLIPRKSFNDSSLEMKSEQIT